MSEALTFSLAAFAGLFLGVLFFGGLWWTVRVAVVAKQPALWFLGSWVVRVSIVLAGFYFVGVDQWQRLLVCLLGFIAGRLIVTRFTRMPRELRNPPAKEASHAT